MKNINKTINEYDKVIKKNQPPVNKIKNIIKAYLVGGLICVIGQGFWNLYIFLNISKEDAGTLSSITMIFLGGLLTGMGIYDEIGQFAGAGSIVPVTGFANSIVSPALEFKQEGLVQGIGAKMYLIAGPVLTYGMVSAFLIGVLKILLGG